jgi:hypothetical protein
MLSVIVLVLSLAAYLWTRRRRRRRRCICLDARVNGRYAAERPLFSTGGEILRPVSIATTTSIPHEGTDRWGFVSYLHEMPSVTVTVAYTNAGMPMAHVDMQSRESLLRLQPLLIFSSVHWGVP